MPKTAHPAHSDPRAFGGGRWGGCSSEPSPEQAKTLIALACLTLLHGREPSCRELAEVLGCSRQAAQYRLHYLDKKGLWNSRRWSLPRAGMAAALASLQRPRPAP